MIDIDFYVGWIEMFKLTRPSYLDGVLRLFIM